MGKTHYTAYEAANMIFIKATKDTAPRYIRELYLLGELRNSTKISNMWYISQDDIDRIRPRILSGELRVVLPVRIKK